MAQLPSLLLTLASAAMDALFVRWALDGGYAATDRATFWILAGLLGGLTVLVLSGLARLHAAAARGRLTLHIEERPYLYGQRVRGSLELELHGAVEADSLHVRLVSTVGVHTATAVVWSEGVDLREVETMQPGHGSFAFEFTLPDASPSALDPVAEAIPQGMGFLRTLVAQAPVAQPHWRIDARLAALGVDLRTARTLRVRAPVQGARSLAA